MSKEFLITTFILIFLTFSIGISQVPDTTWTKIYGANYECAAHDAIETIDGGYIIIGFKRINSNNEDVFIMKTNSDGDTLWTKTYGSKLDQLYGGDYDQWVSSIESTSDNGYIIAGWTEKYSSTANEDWTDIYILKIDASGDTLWTKTYGDTVGEKGYHAMETSDGGYLITGYKRNYNVNDSQDLYLLKIDSNGNVIWDKVYGGDHIEVGSSSFELAGSEFITLGSTWSYGNGNSDYWLLKINSNGDTLWTKTYGASGIDEGWSFQITPDNGYILAGYSDSFGNGDFDYYLIKTNSSGDTIWTHTYGGLNDEYGPGIQVNNDGGYSLCGATLSFSAGNLDIYFIRTDSNGDVLWSKTYGWDEEEVAYMHTLTSDGGYLIPGTTESFFAGGDAIYLIKIQPDPLNHISSEHINFLEDYKLNQNYPNPFNPSTKIMFTLPQSENVKIVVYNILGQIVHILLNERFAAGKYEIDFNAQNLTSGIYFYKIEAGKFQDVKKMILLK